MIFDENLVRRNTSGARNFADDSIYGSRALSTKQRRPFPIDLSILSDGERRDSCCQQQRGKGEKIRHKFIPHLKTAQHTIVVVANI